MSLVGLFIAGFSLLVLLPAAVLFVEVMAAVVARRRPAFASALPPAQPLPTVCVLMPAHDEALGIARTLRALAPVLPEGARVLVVADNCGDDTAGIARCEGAQVVERHDLGRRGKGYALDFGVRHLAADPPEVVVVVDADCEVAPGALAALALACAVSGRPAQASYLMHNLPGASLSMRISEFAWLVKNRVRPLGGARLGMPCQLVGSGMAFPWAAISRADLASGHIVEDLKLGVDLARAGVPPRFCPQAEVRSVFAATQEGAAEQRRRWEHGHLGVLLAQGPGLLASGLRGRDPRLVAMALDLCVPPLALLVLMALAALLAAWAWWWAAGALWPLAVALAALALIGAAVLAAWHGFGRQVIALRELLGVPLYVLRKLPLYLGFLAGRRSQWVRARRDPGSE